MKPRTLALPLLIACSITACEMLPGIENEAKRELRSQLIDPDSAKFETVTYKEDSGSVCGFFNSKNRMGGYVGLTPFIYNKKTGITIVNEQPEERDFERYFQNIQFSDARQYSELESNCKANAQWANECSKSWPINPNKYCESINQGKSMTDVYFQAKQSIGY